MARTLLLSIALSTLLAHGGEEDHQAEDRPRLVVQGGHSEWVNEVDVSPDGRFALTASADGTSRLWEASTGRELRRLDSVVSVPGSDLPAGTLKPPTEQHSGIVRSFFSPDGRRAVTGQPGFASQLASLKMWNVRSGECVVEIDADCDSARFTPDGRWLAFHDEQRFTVLDADEGRWVLQRHGQIVGVGPEGSLVIVMLEGGDDGFVTAYDPSTREAVWSLPGSSWKETGNPRYLVVDGETDSRLIDVRTGAEIAHLAGDLDDMVISPEGRYLVVPQYEPPETPAAVVRTTVDGNVRARLGPASMILDVSLDGRRVLTQDGAEEKVSAWDVEAGTRLFCAAGEAARLSPDGRKVAVLQYDEIRISDLDGGEAVVPRATPLLETPLCFLPASDALLYVSAGEDGEEGECSVVLVDASSGQTRRHYPLSEMLHLEVSADGTRLLAVGDETTVWSLATGDRLAALPARVTTTVSSVFAARGEILTCDDAGSVEIWSASGELLARLAERVSVPAHFAVSAGGKRLVAADDEGTVVLWDMSTRREAGRFDLPGVPENITFCDSRTLLVDDGSEVLRLQIADGAPVARYARIEWASFTSPALPGGAFLSGPRCVEEGLGCIIDLATGDPRSLGVELEFPSSRADFSPDGRRLLVLDGDGIVHLWDPESLSELHRFRGGTGHVHCVAVSPSGRWIAAGHREGKVVLHGTSGDTETLYGPGHSVLDMAFGADGNSLVCAFGEGGLLRWHAGHEEAWDGEVEQGVLFEGGPSVTSVALGVDGSCIAFGAHDGVVRLLEASGVASEFPGHDGVVFGLALSADGTRLASAGGDGRVIVRSFPEGEILRVLRTGGPSALRVGFGPGGALAVACDDALRVWADAESGEPVLLAHDGHPVYDVAWAPGGERLVSVGGDRTARIWAASEWSEQTRVTGHLDWVVAVRFSPDGQQLVTASQDDTVGVWDSHSGREIRRLVDDGIDGVNWSSVQYVANGSRMVVTGSVGEVVVRDAESGEVWFVAVEDGWQAGVGGDEWLAAKSVDGHVQLLSLTTPGPPRWLGGAAFPPRSLAVRTPAMDRLAVGYASNAGLLLWDLETGIASRWLARTDGTRSLAWGPNGDRLLIGGFQNEPTLWNALGDLDTADLHGPTGFTCSVAFPPDGTWAVTGSWDKTARIWDLNSCETRVVMKGHTTSISSVAASPDGKTVATGAGKLELTTDEISRKFKGEEGLGTRTDTAIRLWSVDTGEEVARLVGHGDSVNHLAFFDGGKRLLSASRDGSARVWDIESRAEVMRVLAPSPSPLRVAVPSPDGRHVLTGGKDGVARLYALRDGTETRRFVGHSAWIFDAAFLGDDHVVTAGGDDVRIWDVATGKELCSLNVFSNFTWAVVAPDGRFDTNDLEAIESLHWVMPDDPLRPLSIETFMREYYEPRLLPRLMAGDALRPVRALKDLNRAQPVVSITSIEPETEHDRRVCVTVEVESRRHMFTRSGGDVELESGAQDLRLFRDGRLVAWRDGPLEFEEGRATVTFPGIALSRTQDVPGAVFSAYAFNVDGVKSLTGYGTSAFPDGLDVRKGTAYVIAYGVNAFDDPRWDLRYAAADARAYVEYVGKRVETSAAFAKVVPILLTSEKKMVEGGLLRTVDSARKQDLATVLGLLGGRTVDPEARARIGGLGEMAPAQPEDFVLITISTHGVTGEDGEFYLLPSDAASARDGGDWLASCICASDLARWLRPIDAEMVMVVDACQSAASVEQEGFKPGPMGSRGLGQLAWNKNMRILAASQAAEYAVESAEIQHGLLTYALTKRGLADGDADFDPKDGTITLSEWLRYGVERGVRRLAEDVAAGRVRAGSTKGPLRDGRVPPTLRLAQRPALFDFASKRDTDDVVLQRR